MTPSGSHALPDSLRRLANNPALLTPLRLWRSLGAGERAALAETFMAEKPVNRSRLVQLVAAARNFRPSTVAKWSDDKVADAMRYVPVPNATQATSLLEVLPRVPERRTMVHRFAGLLGLPDPQAVFDREAVAAVSQDTIRQAADKLLDEFGARDAFVYLLALAQRKVPIARALQGWMQEQTKAEPAEEAEADEAAPAPETTLATAPAPTEDPPASEVDADANADTDVATDAADADEPGRERTFTTLDRVLVQAAVDAKYGIEGALSEDEVDDMVDDYVHLSGRRHRSHFHAGFRDALFGRTLADRPPAKSRGGERWYWAGAVRGWARLEMWPRIVAAYDEREVVRSLGDGFPASIAAVGDVVRALRAEDRLDDLATFVQTRALTASASPDLFESLSDAATDLLRQGEAARALPIFELLERAARSRERGGSFADDQLILAAKRRRAHCLRQLDQHDKARRILTNLLRRGPDAPIRAMLHADLGLMKGGFRGLDDVRLPQRLESLDRVGTQLEAGRDHFVRAVEDNVRYASHGHYCLGVLALCTAAAGSSGRAGRHREYAAAATHLEQAHAVIGTGAGHYGDKLVARIVLYLGIATVLRLSEEDLSRGARRIAEGLRASASLPPYMVKEVMEALDLGAKDDLRRVAQLVRQNGDESAFDALAGSSAVEHCQWLAPALHDRARRPGRRKADVAADLYAALRGYRGAAAHGPDPFERAFEALDTLEGFAMQGIGADRFMEMLSQDDYDCPPLRVEDARIAHARCLEAQGKSQAAANVLAPMFHQLATNRDLFEADGVLTKIKELGVPHAFYGHMEDRLSSLSEPSVGDEGDPAGDDAPRAVTVLVVGGDEGHAKREEQVRCQVAQENAAIAVRFVRSGWSANWQTPIEKTRGLLQECDAVVVMRFMRTHFGKRVREECGAAGVPWRFCWGGGVTAQVRAVEEAARVARSAVSRSGRSAASSADQG